MWNIPCVVNTFFSEELGDHWISTWTSFVVQVSSPVEMLHWLSSQACIDCVVSSNRKEYCVIGSADAAHEKCMQWLSVRAYVCMAITIWKLHALKRQEEPAFVAFHCNICDIAFTFYYKKGDIINTFKINNLLFQIKDETKASFQGYDKEVFLGPDS